jgi:AcrR family transcriptional regulator
MPAARLPGRREQRRLQHQDLGRSQLLDAAEEVFGRRGYHDTTLKEVAELAEFSVGSVYSFFENKDDLFLHVFLRRGAAFLAGLRSAADTADSPVDRLRALVAFEVGFFRDHPHFGRLYLRTSTAASALPDKDVDATYSAGLDEAMGIHAEVFAAGQADGTLRAGDPSVLAGLLSGLVRAYLAVDPLVIVDRPDAGERLPLDDLQAMVVDTFRTPASTGGRRAR